MMSLLPVLNTHPLAEVKIAKLKDCPMLTAGRINVEVFQEWANTCHRYSKHLDKKPEEIVRFVADGMLEPRYIKWYHANQKCIDTLTLDEYLVEFAKRALPRKWEKTVCDSILSSKQGDQPFADWTVDLENLNALLTNTKSPHALNDVQLQASIEANMSPDLKNKLEDATLITTELADWILEVIEQDELLQEERARTQCLIDANNALRTAERIKRKPLVERISDPGPRTQPNNSSTPRLAKLTDAEKAILKEHQGCTRCRIPYCNHFNNPDKCAMKINNTWPDPLTTKPITLEMALAAKPKTVVTYAKAYVKDYPDNNTDESYVLTPSSSSPAPPKIEPPFTMPHMMAKLDVSGPAVSSFPLSIQAMLDNGCPSTVISNKLATQLGLRRFPLPEEEDNLTSLSESPLCCREFVRLEVTLGGGAWKSRVFRAKVNVRLPVPLLLGIPFLVTEHIVLDVHGRTATDKHTGYDLLGSTPSPPHVWAPNHVTPPPTPKKPPRAKPVSFEKVPAPDLDGRVLPPAIMAAVRERVESIALQEKLREKDCKLKETFADRFPLRLLDTTETVPNHIYHHIRLKDPNKVVNARGYATPKKYHDAWKKLLDKHIAAGRI
ncbi:hypothetical protein DXG01_000820 [Tephrocybe rancida]|nr:hypothetical protein DXG01_000820 [Tephrocybe rancida]